MNPTLENNPVEPHDMSPLWRPALVLFVVLSLLTGLLYPLLVTGVAQTVFPHQSNGSLIARDGQAVGFAAAELLDRLMQGKSSRTKPILLTPKGIVVRGSSGELVIRDRLVARAVALQGFGLALEFDDARAPFEPVRHRLLDPAERRLEPQECLIQFLNVCHQSLW